MAQYHSASGSVAEDLFIDLFKDTFDVEKAEIVNICEKTVRLLCAMIRK